jgi:hypothetical protein
MQPLAQPEPGAQVEDGQAGQRDDDVTAGYVGLRGVSQDRDDRGQGHSGVQDPAELVRADADEAGIVSARERDDAQPDQRQAEAQCQVQARRMTPAVETQLEGKHAASERAERVSGDCTAQVGARPHGWVLRGEPRDYPVSPPTRYGCLPCHARTHPLPADAVR